MAHRIYSISVVVLFPIYRPSPCTMSLDLRWKQGRTKLSWSWYFLGAFRLHAALTKDWDQVYVVLPQFQGQKLSENPRIHSRNLLQESKWIHINFSVFQTKGPFVIHCNCVAVPIYWLLSAASHCSITAFWFKMNLTFMRHRNAVTLQFLCRAVQCGNTVRQHSAIAA